MGDRFKLMLLGGPADEVREARPRWALLGPAGIMTSAPDPLPEEVWLCRVEWPLGEWRVRLHPEPSRGESRPYRLQRDPDGNAETAVDGAYLFAHVADEHEGGFEDVTGEAPPIDDCQLSTRPTVVSGGS